MCTSPNRIIHRNISEIVHNHTLALLVRDSPPSGSWKPNSLEESPATWGQGTGDSRPSGTAAASYQSDLQSSPWHWRGRRSYGKSEEKGRNTCGQGYR